MEPFVGTVKEVDGVLRITRQVSDPDKLQVLNIHPDVVMSEFLDPLQVGDEVEAYFVVRPSPAYKARKIQLAQARYKIASLERDTSATADQRVEAWHEYEMLLLQRGGN